MYFFQSTSFFPKYKYFFLVTALSLLKERKVFFTILLPPGLTGVPIYLARCVCVRQILVSLKMTLVLLMAIARHDGILIVS